GADSHAVNRSGVALKGNELLPGLRVPQLHVGVPPKRSQGGGQMFAVRREGHTGDVDLAVPLEGERFHTDLGIPYLHRLVLRSSGQASAIGAEDHVGDSGFVSLEGEQILGSMRVPYLQGAVIRPTTGQALAVRAERYTQATDRVFHLVRQQLLA